MAYIIIDPKPHFEKLNDIYIYTMYALLYFLNGCFYLAQAHLQRIVEFNVIKNRKNKIRK